MVGSAQVPASDPSAEVVRLDLERRAFLNLLRMTNVMLPQKELAWQLAVLVQQLSSCEAVAIRLKNGPDFPYAASIGFSSRFVTLENSLCSTDENGLLLRDDQRHPLLSCVCGRVLSGQVDSTLPCFTPCGSFITESTSNLLGSGKDLEKLGSLRGRCHTAGYETVALFPIRRDGVTYGLIQCNDPQPNRLTRESTDLLEDLADTAAHLFQQAMT